MKKSERNLSTLIQGQSVLYNLYIVKDSTYGSATKLLSLQLLITSTGSESSCVTLNVHDC